MTATFWTAMTNKVNLIGCRDATFGLTRVDLANNNLTKVGLTRVGLTRVGPTKAGLTKARTTFGQVAMRCLS